MTEFGASLLAAFMLGLLGSAHCLGMCGGIMAAFALRKPVDGQSTLGIVVIYNTGRVISYTLFGVLAAAVAGLLPASNWPLARTLAGMMLIAMGLYLGGWWYGLRHLESGGRRLWAFIQPLTSRFTPGASPAQTLMLGMLWGWLPCGLVYSALAYAAVQGSAGRDGLVMLTFGLGTLPAVMAGGWILSSARGPLTRKPWRWLLALAYIAFGVWTVVAAWLHAGAHHGEHQHPPAEMPAAGHHHH